MSALSVPRVRRARPIVLFVVVALAMFVIDGIIARSPAIDARPDLMGGAIAFDLTIGVVIAYWLLIVRTGRASAQSMLGVFGVSTIAATLILGARHLGAVRLVRYFGLPFELAVVGVIVARVIQTSRRHAASGIELDIPERIRLVLGGTSIQSRVADIMATETSLLYYAVASWRRKPFVPANAMSFTYHTKNGYAGILYTIANIALVEAIALDFIIRVKSPLAANIFLAIDLFAAMWILGFARSVQLRPILVTRDEIRVRNGLQWRLDIPRSEIVRIDVGTVNAPSKSAIGYLRAARGRPNVLIEVREPLRAYGPYGITRVVRSVGLTLDDAVGFQRAVSDL